jgi:hypothetical protein
LHAPLRPRSLSTPARLRLHWRGVWWDVAEAANVSVQVFVHVAPYVRMCCVREDALLGARLEAKAAVRQNN